MLSHTRMGVPYEYTHMGRPIRVWDNIRIWGRTCIFFGPDQTEGIKFGPPDRTRYLYSKLMRIV